MARSRECTDAAPLFAAATVAYAANCALGAAVGARLVDTSGFRWLHHVLYITTCATTAAAMISAVLGGRPAHASRRAALALAPATLPLAAIACTGTRTRRHPLIALAAAPFIVAGLVFSRIPSDRK